MPPHPSDRRDLHVHRALVGVAALALTYLAYRLAVGDGPGADTIAWAPGAVNGINPADWPIAAIWLAGLVPIVLLLRPFTRRLHRLALAAALVVVLSFFALTLVKGDGPDSGPTVLAFSPAYGVNEGDLPVIATWVVGIVVCVALGRRRSTNPSRGTDRRGRVGARDRS